MLQPTKPGTYQAVAEYDLAKIAAGDYPKIEFDLLLEYCYSADAKLVTAETAAPLLMLAEEYQVTLTLTLPAP